MIKVYTELKMGQKWLKKYEGTPPIFACILGFTYTGLIPQISAAGATPKDREFTGLADAEFLYHGLSSHPTYPLPPLIAGVSPVFISRAVIETFSIPLYLFNAGLIHPPSVPLIDLGGQPAQCLTTGKALPLSTVEHLLKKGLEWGEKLTQNHPQSYVILGECVVGGTTTALAVLTGLGIPCDGKVNSSHPQCNHQQKLAIVQSGFSQLNSKKSHFSPLELVAAIGDPMQIVVAGMAITASRNCGVLLAGGTQMLAVYALLKAIAFDQALDYDPDSIVVGTTRWVVEDPTGDTIGLANNIKSISLLATQLNFSQSLVPQLQLYEQGFVKEGVGAGGCAIAATLSYNFTTNQLVEKIESLTRSYGNFYP